MALYQTAILLGAGSGPVLGGFVAELLGFRAPFWAFALVSALAALYAWFGYRETLPRRPEPEGKRAESTSFAGSLRPLLGHRGFLAVTIITFGVFFTRTAALWQLVPLVGVARFDLSLWAIGVAMTLQSAANLLVLPLAGSLADRCGHARVIVPSTVGLALCLVLIALAPAAWVYFVAVILLGIAGGIVNPSSTAYAADQAPDGRFGPAMGILRTVGDAGFVAGPILAGLAVDLLPWGYASGLVLNALVIATGALVFARANGEPRPTG